MTLKNRLDICSRSQFRKWLETNSNTFPSLYQRVYIDNIQRNKACKEMFVSRLKKKLIEASERGEMIGDWHDYGRLLDY